MQDNDLDIFFDALLNEEKERKILRLISKGFNDDEILEILLNEDGENP